MFISMLVNFIGKQGNEGNFSNIETYSIGYMFGEFFTYGLFIYTFWISYRTRKIYNGKCQRADFKYLSKSEYYLTCIIMIAFSLLWILTIWLFGWLYGGFDGVSIFIIVFMAIFTFHLLNIVFYIKDNKLFLEGSYSTPDRKGLS